MILVALALAAAPAAQAPREFIEKVYSSYGQEGFNPLAAPGLYFSPELTAAIERDSSGGEVGYLDGDPLCDCQDYDRLSAKVVTILQPSARAATVHVHVDLGQDQARELQLRLILTPLGWRISDVLGADHHSLLHELQKANAKR
ncbi:MAG TPA: DUF3828 domain-containing protein [Sphingomicrobium sp.]|nr:DUF3828 domain-containing protein [Sphingomicrobium sp.]